MKKLTTSFNSAEIKNGEKFEIVLPATIDNLWNVSVVSGKVAPLSEEFFLAEPKRDVYRSPATHSFSFQAKEKGAVEIQAEYKGQKNAHVRNTAHTFKLTVS